MNRVLKIRQHDGSDCGPACLASLAAKFGCRLPLARIRDLASTDASGTSVAGMIKAAEAMGFIAKGVKGSPEALASAPLPSIAHVQTQAGQFHFLVLISINKRRIKLMDPAEGRTVRMNTADFLAIWTGVLILMVPGPDFRKMKKLHTSLSIVYELVRPFRQTIIQAAAGAVLISILGLSTAFYVQKIMDFVLVNRNTNLLNLLSMAMLILLVARMLISWFKSLLMLKTGNQVDAWLITRYYRHLLRLPHRFFDTMRTGEIISRLADAIKIRVMITEGLIEGVVGVLTILVTMIVMALLSGRLFLLMAGSVPVILGCFWIYDRINKHLLRRIMEKAAALESQLVESVQIQRMIRENGMQDLTMGNTESKFTQLLSDSYRAGISHLATAQAIEMFSGLLTLMLLWMGAGLVLKGMITAGELMSFYTLSGYMMLSLRGMASVSRTFRDAEIASDRLFQVLDMEAEKNLDLGIRIQELNNEIRFQAIRFRYGSRPWIFKDLSFNIKVGQMTAIAGRSGCGKSTVGALLEGLYTPQGGRILVNGIDLEHLNKSSWRQKIAVIPQRIEMFSGTLMENIACGCPPADQDELFAILEKTGLIPLINQLPQGIHTHLGEHGAGLSGGESQRLAFARALYARPSLLIMDEPTSALDPESEMLIRSLVQDLRKEEKTLLVMAHQLRTITDADQIVLLEEGEVREKGCHEELLRAGNTYAKFWHQQEFATSKGS